MPDPARYMSAAEYLDRAIEKELREEFVDGEIHALSGGSIRHGMLIANIVAATLPPARRLGCIVMSQCARVRVAARKSYYFPDIVATCEPDRADQLYVSKPCFIAEVLSPSTAGIDRREKRVAYTSLDSLETYVLVYQDRFRIDVYRRAGDSWNLEIVREPDRAIEIPCLGCSLTIAEVYRGIDLPLHISEAVSATFDDEWDLDLRPVPDILLTSDGSPVI